MTALWLLLGKVPRAMWGWLAVIVLAGASLTALVVHERHVGEDRAKFAALTVKTVHDSILVHTTDTLVLRDTVRLTRTLARYDTIRATLNVHDTVAVERFVATADSTVRACRETVSAFALSCAAKDTVITDLRGLLALRVPPQSRGLSWKARAGYLLAGVVLTEVVQHSSLVHR